MSTPGGLHAVLLVAPPQAGKSTFVGALSQHSHVGYFSTADASYAEIELVEPTSVDDRKQWDTLRNRIISGEGGTRTEEPSFYHVELKQAGGAPVSFLILDYPGGRLFSPNGTAPPPLLADLKNCGWSTEPPNSFTVVLFVNHPWSGQAGDSLTDVPDSLKTALRGIKRVDRVVLYLAMADQIWPTTDFLVQVGAFNDLSGRHLADTLHTILKADVSLIDSAINYFRRQQPAPELTVIAGSSYGALHDGWPNSNPRTGGLSRRDSWTPLGVMPVLWFAAGRGG